MHTVMDKNSSASEMNMAGAVTAPSGAGGHVAMQSSGGTNLQQAPAPSTTSAANQQVVQGSAQVAPQGTGNGSMQGHTVLNGGAPASQTGQNSEHQHGAAPQGSNGGADQAQQFAVKFPDGVPVNQELLDNYQAFCADCGLNNEQAQQAVDFYIKEQARQMDAERELSMHILQTGAWKGQFDQRLSVANNAVRALDSQLGGRLQPMLEAGLGNNHVFAEMMACVGDLLQEENFIPHAGGGATARTMSTEDFLRNEVFKTR